MLEPSSGGEPLQSAEPGVACLWRSVLLSKQAAAFCTARSFFKMAWRRSQVAERPRAVVASLAVVGAAAAAARVASAPRSRTSCLVPRELRGGSEEPGPGADSVFQAQAAADIHACLGPVCAAAACFSAGRFRVVLWVLGCSRTRAPLSLPPVSQPSPRGLPGNLCPSPLGTGSLSAAGEMKAGLPSGWHAARRRRARAFRALLAGLTFALSLQRKLLN